MQPRVRKYIQDCRAAASAVGTFAAGISRDQYESNLLIRSAVERQLEIVGESLNKAWRLEPEIEKHIPNLFRIVAMRNRIIHGYDVVDNDLVWDVIRNHIPPLLQVLQQFE